MNNVDPPADPSPPSSQWRAAKHVDSLGQNVRAGHRADHQADPDQAAADPAKIYKFYESKCAKNNNPVQARAFMWRLPKYRISSLFSMCKAIRQKAFGISRC